MEGSSQKIKESKTNHSVNVPESSCGKIKENLENIVQKQNLDDNLNSNSKILNNLKSKYTIKILFSHLHEKIKLKLIKYNKQLQNLFDINIINYKFYSGKYIEYESNGKGKEYYFDGTLLFEGEYINGERNGKGKEYYGNGKLLFEGEYLKGERNGKGKEYDYNGKLKFEGEYLHGIRINGKIYDIKRNLYYDLEKINGLFQEYDSDGILIFEGEYLNGIRNGKGKEYDWYYGELRFDGEYLNGIRSGKGKEYLLDNLIFDGVYLNGKRNGKGKEYDYKGKLIFEGEYLNGKKWNGKGFNGIDNIIYELKNGKGYIKEYYFNDKLKLKFEGE